jgi:predicted dehydrogenase
MRRLRIGVIGCGLIAVNHVKALRGVDNVDVVAVADVDARRAQEFAYRHGVPSAFSTGEGVFGARLDAVTICTPHAAHAEGVVAAARHGVHVLCEKPIAVDVADAERMVEAAERAGVHFGVVFQRRFWPSAVRAKAEIGQAISGGVLVRLRRDAAYYSQPWRGRWDTEGGGVLMTQAIHHIDLLQWLMGPAVRVTGRVATLRHHGLIEVEDTAAAVVEFASGALATIQAGTTFSPGLGAQVWVGDASGRTATVTEFPEGADSTTSAGDVFDLPLQRVHEHLVPYHTQQIQDFVASVREDREPAVTGREAVKSLRIVKAIYESSRTGAPVSLRSS